MKCDACLNHLEEYIDGELVGRDAAQISAHLMTCGNCSAAFDALTAEQVIYARYERGLEIAPSMWHEIEMRIAEGDHVAAPESGSKLGEWIAGLFAAPRFGFAFGGAIAVAIAAIVIGLAYMKSQRQHEVAQQHGGFVSEPLPREKASQTPTPEASPKERKALNKPESKQAPKERKEQPDEKRTQPLVPRQEVADRGVQTDIFYSEVASAGGDLETQKHIERAQMLLRSIRNTDVSGDETVDVSYEKTLSRQLLSENLALRHNAEATGKFPVKSLLGSLEPFLIDIANLPDQAKADELRAVKDRVTRTEIVAVLQSY